MGAENETSVVTLSLKKLPLLKLISHALLGITKKLEADEHPLYDADVMMINPEFDRIIAKIREEDPRFARGAYYFVRQGLDHTIREIEKSGKDRDTNHVSGQELLEGIREFALAQYGPMAYTLFEHWGVRSCEDFGAIVFNLVNKQVLGKTEHDSMEDFRGGYNFEEAFQKPFLPNQQN